MNLVDRCLFIDKTSNREAIADPKTALTYGELQNNVLKMGRYFKEHFSGGSRIGIFLPNSTSYLQCHFSLLASGMVSCPVDPSSLENVTRKIESLGNFSAIVCSNPETQRVFFPNSKLIPIEEVEAYQNTLTGVEAIALEDTASIMFTTGTTGKPKGVMLTQANILSAIDNISDFIGYSADDSEVVVLPLSHSFGLGHVYCNLANGGSIYTESGLVRVGRVLKAIKNRRATGFPGTPLMVGLLLDRYKEILPDRLASLRFMVVNSAPLPPYRSKQLLEVLPNLDLMVYYGLTEASRSTFLSLTKAGENYYKSVGKPIGSVTLRTIDESGNTTPPNVSGEIIINGPTVFKGYFNDEEKTAEVVKGTDFHTGDLGSLDDDGNLFITGRIGEIINIGGLKVSPFEIEQVVGSSLGVGECVVFGLKDADSDTDQIVAGVLAGGDGFDESEVIKHCQKYLENWKIPTKFFELEEIEKTNTGKVKREQMRLKIASMLTEGEC